jgi:hypothetical protein
MPAEQLKSMGHDPEQVLRQVRFLEAYAATAELELREVLSQSEQQSIQEDPAFTIASDLATTLRERGQWLLFFDQEVARQSLFEAGELFGRLGQPFGYFLQVLAGASGRDLSLGRLGEGLSYVDKGLGRSDSPAEMWPLAHPQQQVYLLLAATGSEPARQEFGRLLGSVLDSSPHDRGVAPVGALGTPIRHLWDTARHLYRAEQRSVTVVASHLSTMSDRYAEAMDLARVNQFLWQRGAAPVDVGDIDLIGITALAVRRFGWEETVATLERSGGERSRPLDTPPVRLGLDLGRAR